MMRNFRKLPLRQAKIVSIPFHSFLWLSWRQLNLILNLYKSLIWKVSSISKWEIFNKARHIPRNMSLLCNPRWGEGSRRQDTFAINRWDNKKTKKSLPPSYRSPSGRKTRSLYLPLRCLEGAIRSPIKAKKWRRNWSIIAMGTNLPRSRNPHRLCRRRDTRRTAWQRKYQKCFRPRMKSTSINKTTILLIVPSWEKSSSSGPFLPNFKTRSPISSAPNFPWRKRFSCTGNSNFPMKDNWKKYASQSNKSNRPLPWTCKQICWRW